MSLVEELIKDLLPEQEKKKIVAVYGGGFKPPTKGHFEVVKRAIEENPEIDEFIINIGGKERDGVTPEEAIKIKTSLLKIGFNNQVEEFENCMNKAAETASKKALSILMEAIKNMNIIDALTILNGEDNAATIYLKNNKLYH